MSGRNEILRTVFLDLDGTLTDPREGIVRCIRYALDHLDIEHDVDDDLTWCIGPPLLDSFATIVGAPLAPKALSLYRERFGHVGWQENSPYPGIVEVLKQLASSNTQLYLATSKPLIYATKILEHFDMDRYFVRMFGSELDGTRSSKTDLLRYALAEVDPKGRATMVGDRKYDIVGARANRIRSVGVTYGYGTRDELEQAGADVIIHSPEELALEGAGDH